MTVTILHEDNHLLIVEKPVNIPVQEDRTRDNDLLSMLKQDLKIRYNKPGNVFLGLVHRLDRPVGGVMVFAKTSKAASRLSDRIRKNDFERTYLTVCRGIPDQAHARLEHYLVKNKRENIVYPVSKQQKDAKKAVLVYDMIGQTNQLSLLRVQLHTGRPHQIRVQLAATGIPIYGDQKYGAEQNKPGQQIALWSHKLAFPHPTKDELVQTESYPPNQYPWHLFPKMFHEGWNH